MKMSVSTLLFVVGSVIVIAAYVMERNENSVLEKERRSETRVDQRILLDAITAADGMKGEYERQKTLLGTEQNAPERATDDGKMASVGSRLDDALKKLPSE